MTGYRESWRKRLAEYDGRGALAREAVVDSPRVAQILLLVAEGRSNKEIARVLAISVHTVHTHLVRYYRSHGVHSRTAAAILWIAERTNGRAFLSQSNASVSSNLSPEGPFFRGPRAT